MSHAFISYLRDDSGAVARLVHDLKQFDIDVWLDREKIKPPMLWEEAIRRAISDGAFFIACFSSRLEHRKGTYFEQELDIALERLRENPENRQWFIPVLLSGTIPDRSIGSGARLTDMHRVDLGSEWDHGIRELVSALAPRTLDEHRLVETLEAGSTSAVDRIKAIARVGYIADPRPETAAVLVNMLRSEDSSILSTLHESLARFDGPVVRALVDVLNDESTGMRRHAITILGKIGDDAALPALIERCSLETDALACQDLADALGAFDRPEIVPALEKFLEAENPSVRAAAASALGRRGKRATVPMLIDALADSQHVVREFAARALGEIGDPRAVEPLNTHVEATLDEAIDRSVAALGKLGSPESIPTLSRVVREAKFGWVQVAGLEALSRIGGAEVIPAIRTGLDDGYHGVRAAAANCLGRIGGLAVVPDLQRSATDRDPDVRSAAETALDAIRKRTGTGA